jgi:hypothetical protein
MSESFMLRLRVQRLSQALLRKGVANNVENPSARKYATISIPSAKIKLKISDSYQTEDPTKLFYTTGASGKKRGDLRENIYIQAQKIDNFKEEMADILAQYSYEKRQMLNLCHQGAKKPAGRFQNKRFRQMTRRSSWAAH